MPPSSSWLAVPPQPSSSSSQSTGYTSHMINNIFSYKGNIMLAAIISLLLVILFVLLLHVYAKWFLERSRHRRRRRRRNTRTRISSLILSDEEPGDGIDSNNNTARHSNVLFTFDWASSKGMDPSLVDLIPLFVYEGSKYENGLECVICLSSFEEREVGRCLPKCGHGFHVECIDTWLFSHVNCPICRMPVMCDKKVEEERVICVEVEDQVVTNEVAESQENVSNEVGSGDLEDNSLEIIAIDNVQEFVDENANPGLNANGDSTSSSLSSNSLLGGSYSCSLKRMLSKSRSERKVHRNFSEVES